jgi:hypothetical protein
MDNTREKILDLLHQGREKANKLCGEQDGCEKCQYQAPKGCYFGVITDHLIAHGVAVQKWIPVTERLPDEDGKYLVFEQSSGRTNTSILRFAKDARKVDKYDFKCRWKNAWYEYDSEWGHYTVDSVTHWMPLPEPPKGE